MHEWRIVNAEVVMVVERRLRSYIGESITVISFIAILYGQTDRQADRQADRQTDRLTVSQTNGGRPMQNLEM